MDTIDERYKRGKIYMVKCKYDDNLIYVGSTIRKLNRRFIYHRKSTDCSLYQYVNGDWDNWYIELYEEYPCNNRKELEKREGEIIRLIGTINCKIAGRTMEQYKDYCKEYYEDNKEILAEKKKIYYEKNKEIIAEKGKIYRENNKEIILKQKKKYVEENKEKIKKKKNEKVECDNCGDYITRSNLTRHKKSKKCQEHKK